MYMLRIVRIADSMALGEWVRFERKSQGLTQGELADYAGLGVNFISQVERGKKTAEIGKVLQLLQTLGLDLVGGKRSAWNRISRYIESDEMDTRS